MIMQNENKRIEVTAFMVLVLERLLCFVWGVFVGFIVATRQRWVGSSTSLSFYFLTASFLLDSLVARH